MDEQQELISWTLRLYRKRLDRLIDKALKCIEVDDADEATLIMNRIMRTSFRHSSTAALGLLDRIERLSDTVITEAERKEEVSINPLRVQLTEEHLKFLTQQCDALKISRGQYMKYLLTKEEKGEQAANTLLALFQKMNEGNPA